MPPLQLPVTYNRAYVQTHVQRYKQAKTRAAAIDSLWRIASNADLYSIDELNGFALDGMPEQVQSAIVLWLQSEGFEV